MPARRLAPVTSATRPRRGSGSRRRSVTGPPPRNQMCWSRQGRTVLFGHVLVAGLRHVPLRRGWEALGLIRIRVDTHGVSHLVAWAYPGLGDAELADL